MNTIATRWRKVLRELWYNKTRTLLVLLSIAVGVMGIGMISGAKDILARDMTAAYQQINPPHAYIYTDSFDNELVNAIRNLPEVADAEGRTDFGARIRILPNNNDTNNSDTIENKPTEWQSLELVALDDFNDIRIGKVTSLDGAWPPPKRTLLIERSVIDELNVVTGDRAEIELRNGKTRTMPVAGIAHDVEQVSYAFAGEVYGYITMDTLETFGRERAFDTLLLTVPTEMNALPTEEQVRAVVDRVSRKIERSGRTVYGEQIPEPGKHWADSEVTALLYLLQTLGILAMLLSAFLVVNTMSALLTQQIRQIGIMKTVGALRRQLMTIYIGNTIAFGLLSLLAGVPLGALGAWGITSYIAGLLNFNIGGFRLPLNVLTQEIAVGVITPVLAALYPIFAGTRISIREAMSDYGLGKGQFGQGFLDKVLSIVRGLSRPVLISLRNTFRRKGRLALVLITLTLASAIVISVLSVQVSLLNTVDDALGYWKYDVRVGLAKSYRINAVESQALAVPGVTDVESWGFKNVVRKRPPPPVEEGEQQDESNEQSDSILMIAPADESVMIDPIVREGRWLLPDDERAVVINTELLKVEPDLKVGDDIVLEIDSQESTWRIVGLIYQPLSGRFAYVNFAEYKRATKNVGRTGSLRIAIEKPDDLVEVEAAQSKVAAVLEEQFEAQGYQVGSTRLQAQNRREIESQLNIIVTFLLIMAALLAIVGGLGLMGTMSINVLERTREVGVIRAIGASNSMVLQIVMIEGLCIGVISWLMGTLIALPLGKLLSDQVGTLFLGEPARYEFSLNGALLWLAVTLFLAALASFLPARGASKLTVRETLAYM